MVTLKIRNELRELGYSVTVDGDYYYIRQDGVPHYLSAEEGEQLVKCGLKHPVELGKHLVVGKTTKTYRFEKPREVNW